MPSQKAPLQIALIHSFPHTRILQQAMQYIHQDRDLLLESLLLSCGFIDRAKNDFLSPFFKVVHPKMGTRALLEIFHDRDYLDFLEFPRTGENEYSYDNEKEEENGYIDDILKTAMIIDDVKTVDCKSVANRENTPIETKNLLKNKISPRCSQNASLALRNRLSHLGLEDDCPLPTEPHSLYHLWNYCLAVCGASCHAASLLVNEPNNESDDDSICANVSIHWGGGRHHAQRNKAAGFCYVNDVVLAICTLLKVNDIGILSDNNSSQTVKPPHISRHFPAVPEQIKPHSHISRILYIDLDIHHSDGVQAAFYETDQVLTASFHRYSPGFFPALSGSTSEKGRIGTKGFGYNLNVPLPAGISDLAFLFIFRRMLFGLCKVYDPHSIVLCVGADGLKDDALLSGSSGNGNSCFNIWQSDKNDTVMSLSESLIESTATGEGWALSSEALAECVRISAAFCAGWEEKNICILHSKRRIDNQSDFHSKIIPSEKSRTNDESVHAMNFPLTQKSTLKTLSSTRESITTHSPCLKRKLLLLGGGGYTPSQASRTWLLCTAAACEGACPGLFWCQLPRDIPSHIYFPLYGPTFELVSDEKRQQIFNHYSTPNDDQRTEIFEDLSDSDARIMREGIRAIDLACSYIGRKKSHSDNVEYSVLSDDELIHQDEKIWRPKRPHEKGGRRKKVKKRTSHLP